MPDAAVILRATNTAGASILIDYDSRTALHLPAGLASAGTPRWSRISRIAQPAAIGGVTIVDTVGHVYHRHIIRDITSIDWLNANDLAELGIPAPEQIGRLVHAVLADGSEITRYSKEAIWGRVWPPGAGASWVQLKVARAAHLAVDEEARGGRILLGRPGGRTFDRLVENYRRERDAS